MTIVWILLALLVVFLVIALWGFWFAFVRRKELDISDSETVKNSHLSPYGEAVAQGQVFLARQTAEPWQVISYDGKTLYGRFVPCDHSKGTVIFFHGYRSYYAVDFSVSMEFYHSLGYNLLLVDQRAHGKSQGKVITFGIKERFDVMSWVTYAAQMLGEDHPIFLSGLSMGATTVLMAADMDFPANVQGILADCGFTSPAAILCHQVRNQFHLPLWPTMGILKLSAKVLGDFSLESWSTVRALENAKYPVLFAHGLGDDFVPSYMTRQAYDACRTEKVLLEVEGAGHGVSYLKEPERYQKALAKFLEDHR